MFPHKINYGVKSSANSTDFDPVTYPVGFQSTLNSSTDIQYMDAQFQYRIPLRPFLGTIGELTKPLVPPQKCGLREARP
jgi:hypothetical protein